MKKKLLMLLFASLMAMLPRTSQAEVYYGDGEYGIFFDEYEGATIDFDNPLSITVDGFGQVVFSAGLNTISGEYSVFSIGPRNGNYILGHPYILFDNGDTLNVSFQGLVPAVNPNYGNTISGTSNYDWEVASLGGGPDFYITFNDLPAGGTGETGGVWNVGFEASPVPEPSGALLLGIAGFMGIIRRRRRQA